MVYGYGRGFNRGGAGSGFRGASPAWPYVGRGRGGLPRCGYFAGAWPSYLGAWREPYYWGSPLPGQAYAAPTTRDQELDSLKEQARVVKQRLEDIETRMQNLETRE